MVLKLKGQMCKCFKVEGCFRNDVHQYF